MNDKAIDDLKNLLVLWNYSSLISSHTGLHIKPEHIIDFEYTSILNNLYFKIKHGNKIIDGIIKHVYL